MLLVDTNVIVAAADSSAAEYESCADLLDRHAGELVVTAPVAAESSWMIESRLGPRSEAAFVSALAAGELQVIDLTTADWRRCADLIERYQDLGLGLVDASVVAVAERLGLSTIATLNRRDFAVVRPVHVAAFELVP